MKTKTTTLTPLLVTSGEPAGIGMDVILQLAITGALAELKRQVIVLASHQALQQRMKKIYGEYDETLWDVITTGDKLYESNNMVSTFDSVMSQYRLNAKDRQSDPAFLVIDIPCIAPVEAGVLNTKNAQMVMTQLQLSHLLASKGCVSAIVTGPLQKSVLIEADISLADGSMFTGHTEFFMQQSGCDKVVMMLANSVMRVALVTTHLPLREVADAITPDNVRQTVQIVLDELKAKFGIASPRVLVCGLNPHAGEDGHLGGEEIDIIDPVLREFQTHGANISLAMPADTLFTTRYLKACDAVIAMYHDQGLPVLKSHGFGDTVNLTLGLPYIRTSVDHGTALDLAGKACDSTRASSSSLQQALMVADNMASSVAPSSL